MLNISDSILQKLLMLGLVVDEAKLYLELLKEPSSHLKLAHTTGINRTKVYRLVSDLEHRSLITRRTDDRGTFLVAADPSTLETMLITQEEKVKHQREAFRQLLPMLSNLQQGGARECIVHTYEGKEGFKQMLWHDLKTKGEKIVFGKGTIDDLVGSTPWAEKYRAMTVEAGYTIREILNPRYVKLPFTNNKDYWERYRYREIQNEVFLLKNQIAIYNDTVATYHWYNGQRVGFEVINKNHAHMMRQIFEMYWKLAETSSTLKNANPSSSKLGTY